MRKSILTWCVMMLMCLGLASFSKCSSGTQDCFMSAINYTYTVDDVAPVIPDSVSIALHQEKLRCKYDSITQSLYVSHDNVIFDNGSDIELSIQRQENSISIYENGNYTGNYEYYNIEMTIPNVKDNANYILNIYRNSNKRANFELKLK